MKSAHNSLWIINEFGYKFRFHAKYDDATVEVMTRNVVFMKQCRESSDDYLFPNYLMYQTRYSVKRLLS